MPMYNSRRRLPCGKKRSTRRWLNITRYGWVNRWSSELRVRKVVDDKMKISVTVVEQQLAVAPYELSS